MATMASSYLRGPAFGLMLLVAMPPRSVAYAAAQGPQPAGGRHYAVGDQVPPSVQFDDDGFPNRPYAILIVDRAVVVVVDRTTRRVVEVH
ncbi:MAG TPA: hypothetical protein VMI72_07930 [Roseiarcus sp.]|nr:hypothetical protein [Roseiarcus sp.]